MPKEEWGVKRVCPTTGKRFYDLNAEPIISPYTGEVVQLDTSKTRTMVADKADKASLKDDQVTEDEAVLDDDEDTDIDLGDDVLGDDDVLDDDEDDVSLDDIADVAAEDDD